MEAKAETLGETFNPVPGGSTCCGYSGEQISKNRKGCLLSPSAAVQMTQATQFPCRVPKSRNRHQRVIGYHISA